MSSDLARYWVTIVTLWGVRIHSPSKPRGQSGAVPATFADDDLGYGQWLRAHATGFVVNCERNPKASYLMFHRSPCHTVFGTPATGSTWTAGRYIKVCADTIAELEAWARSATGGGVERCGICVP
ncbi:MAG: hypothetical protein ACRDV4_06315 [Acidimicrobiales bacterium]